MICKNCGAKVSNPKSLIVVAIVEGVLLLVITTLLVLVCFAYPADDSMSKSSDQYKEASQKLTTDMNSTAYYNECTWCPNYGYVTGATLTSWDIGGDEAKYTYALVNEQMAAYMEELDKNFFEKNEFSTGSFTVYSRVFGETEQNIVLSIDQEDKEITIYAYSKQHAN